MAVKTITIDLEAYDLLAADKREGESFSRVIKRRLGRRATGATLAADLDAIVLAGDTLDRIEDLVGRRGESPAASEPLDLPG